MSRNPLRPMTHPDIRPLMEDALLWAIPEDAMPHLDLHVVAGDLLDLLTERDVRLSLSEQPGGET